MAACHYCGDPNAKTEDHIVPKALGGEPTPGRGLSALQRSEGSGHADVLLRNVSVCGNVLGGPARRALRRLDAQSEHAAAVKSAAA